MKQKLFACILAAAGLMACSSQSVQQQLVGADRDARGCVASAGYVWSQSRQACIRIWEEGILLTGERDETTAYVVLSADGTRAEVFLPVKTKPLWLKREFSPEGPYWESEKANWLLKRLPQGWQLFKKDVLLYSAPNPAAD